MDQLGLQSRNQKKFLPQRRKGAKGQSPERNAEEKPDLSFVSVPMRHCGKTFSRKQAHTDLVHRGPEREELEL
jgi:hypothetical protein